MKKYRIPDEIKNPPRFKVLPQDIQLIDDLFQDCSVDPSDGFCYLKLSPKQLETAKSIFSTFFWLISSLLLKGINIAIFRKVLGVSNPVKKMKDKSKPDRNDSDNDKREIVETIDDNDVIDRPPVGEELWRSLEFPRFMLKRVPTHEALLIPLHLRS